MTLFETIKADQLAARKAHMNERAALLTTLIGEASMIGKNNGNRETTDAEVIKVVESFVKNLNANLQIFTKGSVHHSNTANEKEILEKYLPQKYTEDELTLIIAGYVLTFGCDMGKIMTGLKKDHVGNYDGALASKLVKKAIGQ
jgi:uncharacterized protein YqeY